MSASDPIETGRDRAALTREAGIGKLSFISVLAGVLVAYGAFAVLASLAAAAAAAIGLNTDLSANNWAELGWAVPSSRPWSCCWPICSAAMWPAGWPAGPG